MPDPVIPKLGARSFSCPHCGALADQSWYGLFLEPFDRNDHRPGIVSREDVLRIDTSRMDDDNKRQWQELGERLKKNEIIESHLGYGNARNLYLELWNAWVSKCYSCDGFTFWIKDKIVFPTITKSEIKPHEDLPASLRSEFEEAASVLELSPRSSAALLRLCIQRLMPELNQKGKNLNEDIGALVAQGLDQNVQQALDVMRVIGNNAVHPGQIDLKDDKAIAVTLFQLLNLIIERCITLPNKLKEMYANLPPNALEAIRKRGKDR